MLNKFLNNLTTYFAFAALIGVFIAYMFLDFKSGF